MLKLYKKKETNNEYIDPYNVRMFTSTQNPFEIGLCFVIKYIGSHLVEELQAGHGYADGVSTEAIKTILKMREKAGKKQNTIKVNFVIRSSGLTAINISSGETIIHSSIDRISFCTADGTFSKIFAYISRNSINETMECHAFSCSNAKMAFDVSLAVNQAFHVAKEELDQQTLETNPDVKSESSNSSFIQKMVKSQSISSSTNQIQASPTPKSNWVVFND